MERTAMVPQQSENNRRGRVRRAVAGERGVALVEFALVAPVFMLLLLGMLDLGKAFNYWIDTTHMANMGARLAVVDYHPSSGTLQQYIRRTADTGELKCGNTSSIPGATFSDPGDGCGAGKSGLSVCVTYPGSGAAVGQPVQVTVAATYHWLPLLAGKIGIFQTKIRGVAQMRIEQTPDFSTADIVSSGC
jgi:hypothetical protein